MAITLVMVSSVPASVATADEEKVLEALTTAKVCPGCDLHGAKIGGAAAGTVANGLRLPASAIAKEVGKAEFSQLG